MRAVSQRTSLDVTQCRQAKRASQGGNANPSGVVFKAFATGARTMIVRRFPRST